MRPPQLSPAAKESHEYLTEISKSVVQDPNEAEFNEVLSVVYSASFRSWPSSRSPSSQWKEAR